MKRCYAYRAAQPSGKIVKGILHCKTEQDLCTLLKHIGLELVSAKIKETRRNTINHSLFSHKKPKGQVSLRLCRALAELLETGITLPDALQLIAKTERSTEVQNHIETIAARLHTGLPPSQAFAGHSPLLDPISLALLHAGEQSGQLAGTLARIAQTIETKLTLRDELHRAIRYPLFLVLLACGVTFFMMHNVVPEIVHFLQSLDIELPVVTQILLRCAKIVDAIWWVLPAFALSASFLYVALQHYSLATRHVADQTLLRLPLIGEIIEAFALARLMTSLSQLIQSGLTLDEALQQSTASCGNAAMACKLDHALDRLQQGEALSIALSSLLKPSTIHAIQISESTGNLTRGLDRLADTLQKEAQTTAKRIISTTEPTLTILVGAILAWIVLAVLGPVYAALGPLAQGL